MSVSGMEDHEIGFMENSWSQKCVPLPRSSKVDQQGEAVRATVAHPSETTPHPFSVGLKDWHQKKKAPTIMLLKIVDLRDCLEFS